MSSSPASALDRVPVPPVSGPSEPAPVLIVGSVAFDNIETPFTRGDRILGGSGAYASLACSYFAPVRLVGVVGHDFPAEFIGRLEQRGVDLEGLQIDRSGPTFFWAGRYSNNFDERVTLDIQLNVFANFEPVLPVSYRDSRFVMLGNIQPTLQAHVLEGLTPGAFVIADTIDLWINIAREPLLGLLKKIDLFMINESEATLLTGERNLILAGQAVRALGPRYVIVKKGSHGALLFHPTGIFSLPAFPVTDLRDPTGAGDSFAGAFLGYLAAAGAVTLSTLKQAMLYGTATASLTVEAFSCDRLETAGSAAIRERAAQLAEMVSLA